MSYKWAGIHISSWPSLDVDTLPLHACMKQPSLGRRVLATTKTHCPADDRRRRSASLHQTGPPGSARKCEAA
jgi:hypothetical protein